MARIYQTPDMGEAHVRVALVPDIGEADLCVCRVDSWGLASGDALWYITRDRQEATAWVHFCGRGFAQVLVCFVDSRGQAGWRGAHRLQGRFA